MAASVAGLSFIVAHRFQLAKKIALALGRRLTHMPDDEAWRALAVGTSRCGVQSQGDAGRC